MANDIFISCSSKDEGKLEDAQRSRRDALQELPAYEHIAVKPLSLLGFAVGVFLIFVGPSIFGASPEQTSTELFALILSVAGVIFSYAATTLLANHYAILDMPLRYSVIGYFLISVIISSFAVIGMALSGSVSPSLPVVSDIQKFGAPLFWIIGILVWLAISIALHYWNRTDLARRVLKFQLRTGIG